MNKILNIFHQFRQLFLCTKSGKANASTSNKKREQPKYSSSNETDEIKKNDILDFQKDLEIESQKIEEIKNEVKSPIVEYPQVLLPISKQKFTILNKFPKEHKKGIVEDFLFIKLWKKYGTKIKNQVTVEFDNGISFVPDVSFIDNQNNLFIDIEIDEPYSHDDEKVLPIHCIGDDEERNNTFLRAGWNVIRFSEKQIAKHLDECICLIEHFVQKKEYDYLNIQAAWDKGKSLEWAQNDYRNEYLKLLDKEYIPSTKIEIKQKSEYYLIIYDISPILLMPDKSKRVGITAFNENVHATKKQLYHEMEFYCGIDVFCKKIINQLFENDNEKGGWLKYLDTYCYGHNTEKLFIRLRSRIMIDYPKTMIIVKARNPESKIKLSLNENSDFYFVFSEKAEADLKDVILKDAKSIYDR